MSLAIRFNQISLDFAADNAGIANGETQGFGYASHLKRNRGITISGSKTWSTENVNHINDNDFSDTTMNDNDIYWGNMSS